MDLMKGRQAMPNRAWDDISRKRLEGVHPDLRRVMDRVLQTAPFPVRVIDGVRTIARQKELVRIGASRTMRSRHLTGHAVDVVPLVDLDRDGKIETEEMFNWPLIDKLAPVIKAAAKADDRHVNALSGMQVNGASAAPDEIGRMGADHQSGWFGGHCPLRLVHGWGVAPYPPHDQFEALPKA